MFQFSNLRIYLIIALLGLGSYAGKANGQNVASLNATAGFAGEDVIITLSLDNEVDLAGIQFTIRDTPDVLVLKSVEKTNRLSGFQTPTFNDLSESGVAKIIGFTFGGSPIAAGSGDILFLTFEVSETATTGDINVSFDQVVLSTPSAQTVISTGQPGTVTILSPVNLTTHPVGQPDNKFDQTARAADQELFRFGLESPSKPFRLTGLTFDVGLSQLDVSDLSDVQIFEDIGGDGIPDGSPLEGDIVIGNATITATGLDVFLTTAAPRYFILRGTVAIDRVADELSLSLVAGGISGNLEDAVLGNIPARTDGNIANAVHTATGFTGDLSFDLTRNIIDVVKLVGVLLGTISMDGEAAYYDVNSDAQVDIADAVFLIQQILNGETQP